jgi:uracil-DNA glycosylase family 4
VGFFEEARECRVCRGVVAGTAAIGAGNGPVPCPVMFVGEAPGRFGAALTGVPFSGDVAGRRFEALLGEAGLRRDEVFVSNSVLCLPTDECGRNRRPRTSEIRACSAWLARTLDTVRPEVVVALGGVALDGLGRIEAHGLALARDCGRPVAWHGVTVVAVYHPGARAAVHRPWPKQVEDWRALGTLLYTHSARS